FWNVSINPVTEGPGCVAPAYADGNSRTEPGDSRPGRPETCGQGGARREGPGGFLAAGVRRRVRDRPQAAAGSAEAPEPGAAAGARRFAGGLRPGPGAG